MNVELYDSILCVCIYGENDLFLCVYSYIAHKF